MPFAIYRGALAAAAAAFALAVPAHAEGDAEAGARVFAKCQTCHVVADPDGNVLAGRSARTGPNLYGLPGRAAGGYDGFNYGKAIKDLGAGGFTWNEADFVAYVADPVAFLRTSLGDRSARSLMTFKLPREQEALDVWAFIASLSPEAEDETATTN